MPKVHAIPLQVLIERAMSGDVAAVRWLAAHGAEALVAGEPLESPFKRYLATLLAQLAEDGKLVPNRRTNPDALTHHWRKLRIARAVHLNAAERHTEEGGAYWLVGQQEDLSPSSVEAIYHHYRALVELELAEEE